MVPTCKHSGESFIIDPFFFFFFNFVEHSTRVTPMCVFTRSGSHAFPVGPSDPLCHGRQPQGRQHKSFWSTCRPADHGGPPWQNTPPGLFIYKSQATMFRYVSLIMHNCSFFPKNDRGRGQTCEQATGHNMNPWMEHTSSHQDILKHDNVRRRSFLCK